MKDAGYHPRRSVFSSISTDISDHKIQGNFRHGEAGFDVYSRKVFCRISHRGSNHTQNGTYPALSAFVMPVYPVQSAKRALVTLMKKLAIFYAIILNVDRDSPDRAIHVAFKKISVKAQLNVGNKPITNHLKINV